MPRPQREVVVLIHGLWLSRASLAWLAHRLAHADFEVRRFSYATREPDWRRHAEDLGRFAAPVGPRTVHWVGHSLGGILIRALFHYCPPAAPGRIVTLGSPHGGSHAARQVGRVGLGRRMLGANVLAILDGVPPDWAPPRVEIGVVRGRLGLGLGRLLPGLGRPNDGVISLEEASWDRASAICTLPVSHLGMLVSPRVAAEVGRFLRDGRFAAPPAR